MTIEKIFNLFFNTNSTIIYVVNENDKVEGIITLKKFFKQLIKGENYLKKKKKYYIKITRILYTI